MLQTDFRREMGCSGSFASVRDVRTCGGVCGGYFLAISENKFVLVRGASEHEIDKQPLRFNYSVRVRRRPHRLLCNGSGN